MKERPPVLGDLWITQMLGWLREDAALASRSKPSRVWASVRTPSGKNFKASAVRDACPRPRRQFPCPRRRACAGSSSGRVSPIIAERSLAGGLRSHWAGSALGRDRLGSGRSCCSRMLLARAPSYALPHGARFISRGRPAMAPLAAREREIAMESSPPTLVSPAGAFREAAYTHPSHPERGSHPLGGSEPARAASLMPAAGQSLIQEGHVG